MEQIYEKSFKLYKGISETYNNVADRMLYGKDVTIAELKKLNQKIVESLPISYILEHRADLMNWSNKVLVFAISMGASSKEIPLIKDYGNTEGKLKSLCDFE